MNLAESTILITGGGRGIGNYLALNLAKRAQKVIVIDKDEISISNIDKSTGISSYICDLTDPEKVEQTIEAIFNESGNVNVLINNAGLIHSELLLNILKKEDAKHSIENWKRTIDANLNSVFYVTLNVVHKMQQKRIKNGVIINVSSISAQGNTGQSAYAAAKAGVEALTKTWSKELAMFKIRSCAIAPGFYDTESTRSSLSENVLNKWEQSVPLKRLGRLEELLSGVNFIIENDYFNGKVLSLDGGLTI